jgi:ionotropic glutamate receptor
MMLELISRLAFIIAVNCYLLGVAATEFSSPALSAEKNYDRLNGTHLKFAVAHVNICRHFYFTAMAKQYM